MKLSTIIDLSAILIQIIGLVLMAAIFGLMGAGAFLVGMELLTGGIL